jgi:hypothetical protein
MCADTVVVTSPDVNAAVLSPTLSDAIAAVQFYAAQVAAAQTVILAAQGTCINAENVALAASSSATASAAAAAASGAAGGISTTVALLPAGTEGLSAFATNGRKIGEGVGAGTGVKVYWSAGLWRSISTDAQVHA